MCFVYNILSIFFKFFLINSDSLDDRWVIPSRDIYNPHCHSCSIDLCDNVSANAEILLPARPQTLTKRKKIQKSFIICIRGLLQQHLTSEIIFFYSWVLQG